MHCLVKARLRLLFIVIGLTFLSAAPAAALDFMSPGEQRYVDECGQFWPTQNTFETGVGSSGYSITWKFTLSQTEVAAGKCLKTRYKADFVEIDFRTFGFVGQSGWDAYWVVGTNLIGAVHDIAAEDEAKDTSPGATGIAVDYLVAGKEYYLSIAWNNNTGISPDLNIQQRVSFEWVPSRWASSFPEKALCGYHFYGIENKGWCIFGVTRAYVSHGYRNQVSVPFSGYQSFIYPAVSVSPVNPVLYQGYVPDGFIIQSTENHLYVAAGGRLFWLDKNNAGMLAAFRNQMQQRHGSTAYPVMDAADVHAVEVNRTSTGAYSPGRNMPADNTFMYEYGTTQQYVTKFQHPFAVGSPQEAVALGGQGRAVMVPPGLADLQAYPPQWVQNDLLLFGTDPAVWHFAGTQGFRVSNVPTRDCLSIRWNRGVTLMPASAWHYFPAHPTQQSACDFADGQWLYGTPSNRQAVVLYGAGYNVGSAEEVIALGGQDRARPVADETVNGLLARTGSLPNDELVKAYNDPRVYHVVGNKLHYVGSPVMRDCLAARSGKQVRTVPIDLIGRMQANGQTGQDAYCELENHQLLAPNGTSVAYIKDGYRRPVSNPAIRDCIAVRTGAGQPRAASGLLWDSFTAGPDAYCPYEREVGLNFVQEAGSPTVWLVRAGGTKQHVGSLCVSDPYTTQLKKFHVWTVPAGETAGHVQTADFWAGGEACAALPG